VHPSCKDYELKEIKNYEVEMASDAILFVTRFVKLCQSAQKPNLGRRQKYRQEDDLTGLLPFHVKERSLKINLHK
jgi:hypothetical protein